MLMSFDFFFPSFANKTNWLVHEEFIPSGANRVSNRTTTTCVRERRIEANRDVQRTGVGFARQFASDSTGSLRSARVVCDHLNYAAYVRLVVGSNAARNQRVVRCHYVTLLTSVRTVVSRSTILF
jgi:hypothetical protein